VIRASTLSAFSGPSARVIIVSMIGFGSNPIAVRSRALPTKSSSTICTSGSPTSATANIALPS